MMVYGRLRISKTREMGDDLGDGKEFAIILPSTAMQGAIALIRHATKQYYILCVLVSLWFKDYLFHHKDTKTPRKIHFN
ncbi:hypothetical protein NIES592_16130 [Fischerella major NIES-592]|uniref:Uncharacterized protein n=1 Tax=Fischerella major NIES-592 TaxID=210994 RepID=A0A1U7GWT8_9CYAN|nr:hypothetical protein NIES592_16130 [Fischerella major NIES-592]